jgi:hypothetical protein
VPNTHSQDRAPSASERVETGGYATVAFDIDPRRHFDAIAATGSLRDASWIGVAGDHTSAIAFEATSRAVPWVRGCQATRSRPETHRNPC